MISCISHEKPNGNVIIPYAPILSRPYYNILEYLGNMPTKISILDLLCTSPLYKEILDSVLHESRIPTDINAIEFRNLVGHLSTSCALSFKTSNILFIELGHILPLSIAIMVSNFEDKSVMIDNDLALNLVGIKLSFSISDNTL